MNKFIIPTARDSANSYGSDVTMYVVDSLLVISLTAPSRSICISLEDISKII